MALWSADSLKSNTLLILTSLISKLLFYVIRYSTRITNKLLFLTRNNTSFIYTMSIILFWFG